MRIFRATVALALLWGACRGRAGSERSDGSPATTREVVLRLQVPFAGDERLVTEGLLAAYNASQDRVRVVQQAVPAGMAADLMRTQLSSGAPADVYWFALGELVGPMIDAGQILPLDRFYERYQWGEQLIPWARASARRRGQTWALPRIIRGIGFWYRVDLFARHGVAPPRTSVELEAACEKLAAADVACLSLGGRFGWNTMRLLDYFLELEAGPELHDRLSRLEVSWDRAEVVAAYRRLRRWAERGFIVPNFLTIAPEDARLPFYKGDAAMVLEGDWLERVVANDEQPAERFDFFVPPTDHQPLRLSGWSDAMFLPAASRHPDEAAAFLDWVFAPEHQAPYHQQSGAMSARLGVEPDRAATPRLARWRRTIETLGVFPPTDQVFPKEIMDRWIEIQDQVVAGRLAPEQAALLVDSASKAGRTVMGRSR